MSVVLRLLAFFLTRCILSQAAGPGWTDPETDIEWYYLAVGPWKTAKSCSQWNLRQPTREELMIAQERLRDSELGKALHEKGELIWSSTPVEGLPGKYWAVYLDSGDASAVYKDNPLVNVCIGETPSKR